MEPAHEEFRKHSKHFFFASFIIIAVISVYMIRSYIAALLGSIILAYAFYPLFKKLSIKIHNRTLSALILSAIIILIVTVPVLFAANKILNESIQLFHEVRELEFDQFSNLMKSYFGENIDFGFYFKEIVNGFSVSIAQKTSDFVISIPKKAISVFIMIFVMFYLFLDGKKLVELIKKELPLKENYKREIFGKFNDTVYAVIYGVVVTALIQGSIGALGLWIFDVPSPLVWGIVMTILAMLPFVGAFLIWLPAAIIKLSLGDTFNGIGLLLYGLFIVSTIDNIVKPKIIGHRSRIHPALVLLGVFGGLKVFGLFGIVIGPLILAILTVFLEIYISEKNEPLL